MDFAQLVAEKIQRRQAAEAVERLQAAEAAEQAEIKTKSALMPYVDAISVALSDIKQTEFGRALFGSNPVGQEYVARDDHIVVRSTDRSTRILEDAVVSIYLNTSSEGSGKVEMTTDTKLLDLDADLDYGWTYAASGSTEHVVSSPEEATNVIYDLVSDFIAANRIRAQGIIEYKQSEEPSLLQKIGSAFRR